MKNNIGFSIGETPVKEDIVVRPKEAPAPVCALVLVRFIRDGRAYTYFNDKFVLEIGDHVFVNGKLAGQLGVVEKITTKFKINLADYKRVISKASVTLHGTYESIIDKMVIYDRDALSPDAFRASILPPKHWDSDEDEKKEEEIIIGDGYELDLSALESNDEVNKAVLGRAIDYCQNGKVAYVAVRNGIGTAFVEGSTWYEINFRLCGNMLTEMYCDCFYPGLCKHLLAVAMTIQAMVKHGNLNPETDFVAIEENRFWNMVARTTKRVTL